MKNRDDSNLTYTLHLDSQCNQRCLFCMKKKSIEAGRVLTFDMVSHEIKKAKHSGFKIIDFYGGEPSTYTFLDHAIRYANKIGCTCYLATNAVEFSSIHFSESFFSQAKVSKIRTTLHSYQAALHDKVTRLKGSFLKTTMGIQNILKLSDACLSINVVITALNYTDLTAIVNFVHNLGVKEITFSGLVWEGEILNHPSLVIDFSKIKPNLSDALLRCETMRMNFRIMKLPACLLKKKYQKQKYITAEKEGNNFIKLTSCSLCRLTLFCPGFEKHFNNV